MSLMKLGRGFDIVVVVWNDKCAQILIQYLSGSAKCFRAAVEESFFRAAVEESFTQNEVQDGMIKMAEDGG